MSPPSFTIYPSPVRMSKLKLSSSLSAKVGVSLSCAFARPVRASADKMAAAFKLNDFIVTKLSSQERAQ